MNKSEIRQLVITLTACVLTGITVLCITRHANKKIAVVDAVQLFNAYNMKQELEQRAAAHLELLAHQADSIKQVLTVKSKTEGVQQAELQALVIAFKTAQNQMESEYQESNQSINEQVWKRLNPVVDEFGKKENLRLIIGANGMGSVLYKDEYYDKTAALIEFVNKKYEEGH